MVLALVGGCASGPRSIQNVSPSSKEQAKEKITGVGGVFIKARNPKEMAKWYRDHLGIDATRGYADFSWRDKEHPEHVGRTTWALFPTNTPYFRPSTAPFMINYRVANLERMVEQLRRSGVTVDKVQDFNYGRFAWITDPEGNRIELWEPKGE